MKVKRDVITSITASLVAVTLVIICVLTFITGVIVFIGKRRNVFDVMVSLLILKLKMFHSEIKGRMYKCVVIRLKHVWLILKSRRRQ